MVKVKFETKAQNRDELRKSLDIKCAELGMSRSEFAVKELGVMPYVLSFMFKGITNHRTHIEAARKVCNITGAPLQAWEN